MNAQTAARTTRPANVPLHLHAQRLWAGKRLESQGETYAIIGASNTQNGLEILAKNVATGRVRSFFASLVQASSIR